MMNPYNNFATYDAADLQIISKNKTYLSPKEAVVRNSGQLGPVSKPKAPKWANLTHGLINMIDTGGTMRGTQYSFEFNLDKNTGNNLARIHAVNSKIGQNTNLPKNMVLGSNKFNLAFGRAIENTAVHYISNESWQARTGGSLNTTLTAAETIGKNAAGQYYYNDQGVGLPVFPQLFVDNVNKVLDINNVMQPGINEEELNATYVIEYTSKPTYSLDKANLLTKIKNTADPEYNTLFGDNNEDFDITAGSDLENAAHCLQELHPLAIKANLTLYSIDLGTIGGGNEVQANKLGWKVAGSIPVKSTAERPAFNLHIAGTGANAGLTKAINKAPL